MLLTPPSTLRAMSRGVPQAGCCIRVRRITLIRFVIPGCALGAGPESIPPDSWFMDSGLALRAPRNEGYPIAACQLRAARAGELAFRACLFASAPLPAMVVATIVCSSGTEFRHRVDNLHTFSDGLDGVVATRSRRPCPPCRLTAPASPAAPSNCALRSRHLAGSNSWRSREDLLITAAIRCECRFPAVLGLDAVAVARCEREWYVRLARHGSNALMPQSGLILNTLKAGLIETGRRRRRRPASALAFLIKCSAKGERHLDAVAR